jgi:vanillate O-demethylase ferredoxin subunit
MARALQGRGAEFELHYCARSPARMAFRREIEAGPFAACTRFHVSGGDPARSFDAARVIGAPEPDTHLYVCGPAGFMDHVLSVARGRGWAEAQLHREHFGAAVPADADAPFEVELARSGRTCYVPAGRSVLQVLLDDGVDLPFSCESGVCGTCLTRVLDGLPEHRDNYLTDAERAANDQFLPCCSRARTPRLLLDL